MSTPETYVARKTSIRMRPDLQVKRYQFQGRTSWVVKNPVSLRYFRLTDEEYTVLQMLNGDFSLADIKARLEERYPPRVTTHEELQTLLQLFHQRGLAIADAFGQGAQLLNRRYEHTRRLLLSKLASPLFIRLPGVDPERFLSWVYPKVRWLFFPGALVLYGLLVFSALTLITIQVDAVVAKMPTFQQFFAARNLAWMMLALALSKVLHELAHGLTCKHFGSECHEIGILFLVFTPCLYCDTTDSWMLPNKWHRAAIGAAGMVVEVLLASVCTFFWWFSQPGLLHYLCLNTMFVCSVSTVIFNGNPLLRYDGYYILADLLEVPNLWQRSRAALIGVLRQSCLGLNWTSDTLVPEKNRLVFALYAVASTAYRWMVLLLILWFLNKAFEPHGLQVIGQLLVALVLIGLVIVPLWKVVQFFRVPGRVQQVKRSRALLTTSLFLLVVLAIAYLPLPHYVMTTLIIQPDSAQRIYVNVPGILEKVDIQPGDRVVGGRTLAQLTNVEVTLEVAKLTGQRDRLKLHLTNLVRRQGQDRDAAEQIPQTRAALADVEDRLRGRREDQNRLTLVAPGAGVVMPPPEVPAATVADEVLPQWSGSPFDTDNRGCFLETGTLFCLIGDEDRMEAVLVIDQGDIEFVRKGQSVEMKLDEYPAETLTGRIERVAKVDLRVAPRELSHKAGGELTTVTDPSGVERTLGVSYQARVRLDPFDGRLLPGFRGRGKIHAGRRSLGTQVWRLVQETFHFQ